VRRQFPSEQYLPPCERERQNFWQTISPRQHSSAMITRGYYIGEIVDEFSAIAAQVKMRNRLNLTDLSLFAENFFKDVVNRVLGAELKNLNEDRSNEPGLDLGDDVRGMAVQVTATGSSKKIDETLKKITPDQQKRYKKIIVLSIGGKQKQYSFDLTRAKALNFSAKSIWDMNTLAKKAMNLEIDKLESLHKLIRANVAKVKVELEIPDASGKYPTSGYDQWEPRIKPKVGDGLKFAAYVAAQAEIHINQTDCEEISAGLKDLGKRLSRLPRVTREFLVMLVERRERGRSKRFRDGWIHLLESKVRREFRGPDLDGELGILAHANFVSINGENREDEGPTEIGVRFSFKSDDLAASFLDFINEKGLSLRRVIGDADLSAF
jgi:hypothetical protein